MVAAHERPAARRTRVRPDARVDLAVARQVAVADERLVARRARVRAREHVRRLVLAQVARADERLAARGAQVGPLAAVRALVDLQLARGAVRLAARRARVRTLARVRARVRLQAARLRERPAARRARVRLHARVHAVVDRERATGETHGRTGGALPQETRFLPSVSSVAVRQPAVVVGELRVDVLRDVVFSLNVVVVIVVDTVYFWYQILQFTFCLVAIAYAYIRIACVTFFSLNHVVTCCI